MENKAPPRRIIVSHMGLEITVERDVTFVVWSTPFVICIAIRRLQNVEEDDC